MTKDVPAQSTPASQLACPVIATQPEFKLCQASVDEHHITVVQDAAACCHVYSHLKLVHEYMMGQQLQPSLSAHGTDNNNANNLLSIPWPIGVKYI
jgi:hypothetical protein